MSISRVIAQLRTTDLDATIRFYTEQLGFSLAFRHQDFYAGIAVGDQLLHVKRVDSADPSIAFVAAGGHLHLYFETDDVDAYAATLAARRVGLLQPPRDTAWRTREMALCDDQGHTLYFGQAL